MTPLVVRASAATGTLKSKWKDFFDWGMKHHDGQQFRSVGRGCKFGFMSHLQKGKTALVEGDSG